MPKKTATKESPTDHTLLLDDRWYDAAYDALRQMARTSEREHGRKPTLEEFRQLLAVTLGANAKDYFDDGDTLAVTEVIFKTKKKPRTQPYDEGDVFAIKLSDGQYAFGRILRLKRNHGVIMIEIFRETSTNGKYKSSIASSGRLLHFLMTANCIERRRWTIVYKDKFYRLSDADAALEFLFPDNRRSHRGELVAWNFFEPRTEPRSVTDEEIRARGLVDGGFASPDEVEDSIRKALATQGNQG